VVKDNRFLVVEIRLVSSSNPFLYNWPFLKTNNGQLPENDQTIAH